MISKWSLKDLFLKALEAVPVSRFITKRTDKPKKYTHFPRDAWMPNKKGFRVEHGQYIARTA
jgi:hypothetical protein